MYSRHTQSFVILSEFIIDLIRVVAMLWVWLIIEVPIFHCTFSVVLGNSEHTKTNVRFVMKISFCFGMGSWPFYVMVSPTFDATEWNKMNCRNALDDACRCTIIRSNKFSPQQVCKCKYFKWVLFSILLWQFADIKRVSNDARSAHRHTTGSGCSAAYCIAAVNHDNILPFEMICSQPTTTVETTD